MCDFENPPMPDGSTDKGKSMFSTMKLVYRNMVWNRPKLGLYGLLFMAGFCSVNTFMGALKFGTGIAWILGFLSLTLWLVGLPMIITLIDIKQSPKRIDALLKVMHEGQ